MAGQTTTDVNGKFSLQAPGPGTFGLDIAKTGYTSAERIATVIAGLDTAVVPVYLNPLDSKQTIITSAGGTAVNSDGSVEVMIPSGAVNQSITVTATEVVKSRNLPAPLPANTPLGYSVDVEALEFPSGIQFSQPVTVMVANTLEMMPGMTVPYASWNPATLHWDDMGRATVSADGKWVVFTTTHFTFFAICCSHVFVGQSPGATPVRPQSYPNRPDSTRQFCKTCQETEVSGIGIREGDNRVAHAIPPYRSLGVSRSVSVSYNQLSANPNFLISKNVFEGISGDIVPQLESVSASIDGVSQSATYAGTPGPAKLGGIFEAVSGSGTPISTGAYPYQLSVSNYYPSDYTDAACFGCPPLMSTVMPMETREPASLTDQPNGMMTVVNRAGGPEGNGWDLGIPRAYPGPGGNVMVTDGDGEAAVYTKNGGFETGTLFGYQVEADLAQVVPQFGPIFPAEGQYMAMITNFPSFNNATITSNRFIIPPGATTLNLSFNMVLQSATVPTGVFKSSSR